MSQRIILIAIAALLFAGASQAEEPDFGRPGWYLGIGGGVAWDFVDALLEDATGGVVEIGSTGTFNARGGYRAASWFAIEGMYEGAYGYDTKFLGQKVSSFDTQSLVANLKFIIPTWRIHPYFVIGPGAQYGNFDSVGPILSTLDTSRWDFMLRLGIGVDGYITEHWLLNVELAPSIRFTDWVRATQSTDNVAMTLSFGAQYRF
jgi:opacity protein-like surface antigen